MKRATGTGGIIKLSGKRRNPYAVRVTGKIDDNGKQTYVYLGYYPTRKEAEKSLNKLDFQATKTYKHGYYGTRLYGIFQQMKQRCYDKHSTNYKNYGGRGITICDEWKNNFENFYSWAVMHGYSDDLTIDRMDVNGNYEPSNCRWATKKEQARNKRTNKIVEINGEKHLVVEWAEITGLSIGCIYGRIRRGEKGEDIIRPTKGA